jgi:hypothetical protein
MKIFATTAIALAGLLGAFPAAADWQYTKWGMSIDQAVRASGNARHLPNSQEQSAYTVKGLAPSLVGSHDTASFHFTAALYFAGPGRSLSIVKLNFKDYAQWPSLFAELRGRYGEPFDKWNDPRGVAR